MRGLIFLLGAIFLVAYPVYAQVSNDILNPYRAYSAAVDAGDKALAVKHARKAYEAAEKILGDHKTTGDLAQNYADALSDYGDDLAEVEIVDLYLRSGELALHYKEDSGEVAVQRYISAAATKKLGSWNKTGLKALEAAEISIIEAGLVNSIYDGEVRVLRAKAISGTGVVGRKTKVLEKVEEALSILEKNNAENTSPYYYFGWLQKAQTLSSMDSLQGVLEYQSLLLALKGKATLQHPVVSSAFGAAKKLRARLEKNGRLEEAKAAGLCDECWPFDIDRTKVTPLVRVPPRMPSKFMQYNQSGHVEILYDVDDAGGTTNIRVVSTTHGVLKQAAIDSVSKWKFVAKTGDEDEFLRLNIKNKVSFRMADSNGRVFPEP